jgi:ribosomal protein S26
MADARAKKDKPTPQHVPYAFCSNCGQEVTGDTAMKAANPLVRYCPVHGCRLRQDGSCPDEDT